MRRIRRIIFAFNFLRARLAEINNNLDSAIKNLQNLNPPDELESLRDAYMLRLVSLLKGSDASLKTFDEIGTKNWFRNCLSDSDRYCKVYCDYVMASIFGDRREALSLIKILRSIDVKPVYKVALLIT
jgi:hypothetical protein